MNSVSSKIFPIASHRKWLFTIALLTSGCLAVFYLLVYKNIFGYSSRCGYEDLSCLHTRSVVEAFMWGFFLKSIIITSLLLTVFPERAFRWWRWFAVVAIPLASLEITTTESVSSFGISYSAHNASTEFGFLFLAVSILIALVVTVYDFFTRRKQKRLPTE